MTSSDRMGEVTIGNIDPCDERSCLSTWLNQEFKDMLVGGFVMVLSAFCFCIYPVVDPSFTDTGTQFFFSVPTWTGDPWLFRSPLDHQCHFGTVESFNLKMEQISCL